MSKIIGLMFILTAIVITANSAHAAKLLIKYEISFAAGSIPFQDIFIDDRIIDKSTCDVEKGSCVGQFYTCPIHGYFETQVIPSAYASLNIKLTRLNYDETVKQIFDEKKLDFTTRRKWQKLIDTNYFFFTTQWER